MKLEIKKIQLGELESFIQSSPFQQFEVIPITPQRALSYCNNPAANSNDVVLYMGFINQKLVAFRTIFAGKTNKSFQNIHFGWCSGNWVHPDFRRKGFSEQLLYEAFSDWNGKLMFTNYAPNSEKLYLKTGRFQAIHQFNGIRGYLYPKTRKLVSSSNKNSLTKAIFSLIDLLISLVSIFRLLFFKSKISPNLRFEIIPFPDEYCYSLMEQKKEAYFFERDRKEMEWIFTFPWILNDKKENIKNYPFSSWSSSFSYYTVKIYVKNQPAGFLLFSVREGHLKTLLVYIPHGIEDEVVNYLKIFCTKNQIEIITVYHEDLAKKILDKKFPFLKVKRYGQKIYGSFEADKEKKYLFQDGDGDVIFT